MIQLQASYDVAVINGIGTSFAARANYRAAVVLTNES